MVTIKNLVKKTEKKPITNIQQKYNFYLIWYSPPFCSSVKTKTGREFKNFVKKNILINLTHYQKYSNRHYMRISYSCMANLKRLIKSHN